MQVFFAFVIVQLIDPVRIVLVFAAMLILARNQAFLPRLGIGAVIAILSAPVLYAIIRAVEIGDDPFIALRLATGILSSFILAAVWAVGAQLFGRGQQSSAKEL